jgi:hypothetical protein
MNDRREEEWMQNKLLSLRDMPGLEQSPEAEKAGRARFLSEAAVLRKALPVRHSSRQSLWETLGSFISGKQARLAFYAATVMCVVLGLLLASGGTVVFASQGSQPGQVLYPVKLISENVRLGLAANPQSQFQLNLEFAGRRLDEIDKLVQAGQDPSSQVTDRLQNELNAALDSAANLDTSGSVKALENLQANLVQHQNQLLKLQSQANPRAVGNYTRVVEMLQQKVNLAEQGIKDPQTIHQILKQQKKQDKQLSGSTPTPTPPGALNNAASTGTSTPAATAATAPAVEQKNNPGPCNNQNKSNNGNNNGNGNGNQCDEPGTQLTAPSAQPDAATAVPKPNNPNKPVKTPKDNSDKGNKGGNGHKK